MCCNIYAIFAFEKGTIFRTHHEPCHQKFFISMHVSWHFSSVMSDVVRPLSPRSLTWLWSFGQTGLVVCLLQDNTGRLLKHMASATDDLDALFAELDASLTNSRQIFSQVAPASSAESVAPAHSSHAAYYGIEQGVEQERLAAISEPVEVPAYVHVGDPMVSEQPCVKYAASRGSLAVNW